MNVTLTRTLRHSKNSIARVLYPSYSYPTPKLPKINVSNAWARQLRRKAEKYKFGM